jgi:DNA polymerase II large subunit
MCNQFKISDYLRSRIESLIMELNLIFKEEKKEQVSLMDFMT